MHTSFIRITQIIVSFPILKKKKIDFRVMIFQWSTNGDTHLRFYVQLRMNLI